MTSDIYNVVHNDHSRNELEGLSCVCGVAITYFFIFATCRQNCDVPLQWFTHCLLVKHIVLFDSSAALYSVAIARNVPMWDSYVFMPFNMVAFKCKTW